MNPRAWIAPILAIFLLPGLAQAQKVEITPVVGYMFGGKLTTAQTEFRIQDHANFGGTVGFNTSRDSQIELLINWQPTRVTGKDRTSGVRDDLFDVDVIYLQLGGLYEIPTNSKAVPFMSLSLGATSFNPGKVNPDITDNLGSLSTEWRFSGHFGFGGKFDASNRIGFRLQGRLWVNFVNANGGFWCGTGGCAVGAAGETIVQFETSAGVILKL